MIFLSILHQESDLLKTILNRWTLQIPTEMAPHRRAVRALLHEMLTKEMQLQRDSYRLVSDGNGRPFLETEGEIPLPGISLGHSGGWVTCAARVGPTRDGRDNRPVTISPHSDVPPRSNDVFSNNIIGLDLERANRDRQIAVVISEQIERRWYHYVLHNQRGEVLTGLLTLRGDRRIAVVNVPWYLEAYGPHTTTSDRRSPPPGYASTCIRIINSSFRSGPGFRASTFRPDRR